MTAKEIEESNAFQCAWKIYFVENNCRLFLAASKETTEARRESFLAGYLAACEHESAVIAELRIRFDGIMRKIVLIAICLCALMVVGAYFFKLFR